MKIIEDFMEMHLTPVYWNLYHAKEALKNKEYISGMTFANTASLAFAMCMADLRNPESVKRSVFERKVLPKRKLRNGY